MLKPSSSFLTDRSKVVFLLWISFIFYVSCLSVSLCLVCSLQPYGHLPRADLLALLCVMFLMFCYFPMWCPGSGVDIDDCNDG